MSEDKKPLQDSTFGDLIELLKQKEDLEQQIFTYAYAEYGSNEWRQREKLEETLQALLSTPICSTQKTC